MTKNQVHEWHENRPEGGKRYFRGYYNGRDWRFATTTPEDVDWPDLEKPDLGVWEALRDVLFRKYQRKRLNFRLLDSVDKILERVRAGEEAQPGATAGEKKGPSSARSQRRRREAQ
jgi:hypothetical protein